MSGASSASIPAAIRSSLSVDDSVASGAVVLVAGAVAHEATVKTTPALRSVDQTSLDNVRATDKG